MNSPFLKPVCPGCGDEVEDTDDIHEDEGHTWHLECWEIVEDEEDE